jgi:hypothetical protein
MGQNDKPQKLNYSAPDFVPWRLSGMASDIDYQVGAVTFGTTGDLLIELISRGCNAAEKTNPVLVFHAPLATRIVQEGSLMEYWNAGFRVKGHNIFTCKKSKFLDWLEFSSSGVHSLDRTKHFAIFTDDICIEVLSSEEPTVLFKEGS